MYGLIWVLIWKAVCRARQYHFIRKVALTVVESAVLLKNILTLALDLNFFLDEIFSRHLCSSPVDHGININSSSLSENIADEPAFTPTYYVQPLLSCILSTTTNPCISNNASKIQTSQLQSSYNCETQASWKTSHLEIPMQTWSPHSWGLKMPNLFEHARTHYV